MAWDFLVAFAAGEDHRLRRVPFWIDSMSRVSPSRRGCARELATPSTPIL